MKSLQISLATIFLSLILIGFVSSAFAQKRQIRVYHVVVKTNKGKVKGVLEKNNRDHLFVEKTNGSHVSIPISQVKSIKVKEYPKSHRIITILGSEPGMFDRNLDGTLTQEYLDKSLNIGNSEETYLNTIGKISPFSIYYQASPEYELELLNKYVIPGAVVTIRTTLIKSLH